MILFINPTSENITLSLLQDGICQKSSIIQKGDDFSTFPEMLVEVVEGNSVEEIWCLCGPGAFTRMRIVTLAINTLPLTRNIRLKGCHFFDIIEGYAPILRANDREYILKGEGNDTYLLPKEEIPEGTYMGYGEKNDFTNGRVFIEYREDFSKIADYFHSLESLQSLSPIYLKDPHITCSKKNTSLS